MPMLGYDSFVMDPEDVAGKVTERTKAIMAVNLYGLMTDVDRLRKITGSRNIYIIEDCAQAFLSTDDKGRIAGTVGDIGVYSFENSKHVSTGDGGIVVTNDAVLAERVRKFAGMGFKNIKASTGQVRKNKDLFQDPVYLRHDTFGYNYRLTELAAAVGLAQVERLDYLVSLRKLMAEKFTKAIVGSGCTYLIPQKNPPGYVNSYYTFAARYEGESAVGVNWYDFRKKFIEYGKDGIYAAWALVYKEPSIILANEKGRFFAEVPDQAPYLKGCIPNPNCPVAEKLQPKLMQFPANQGTEIEMDEQAEALFKTIRFFCWIKKKVKFFV